VTYKVSKVSELLPKRKLLAREKLDIDFCRERTEKGFWKNPVRGPILPNGKFSHGHITFPEGYRAPRRADWTKSNQKNSDCLPLKPVFLTFEERKAMLKGNLRKAKKTIPKGEYIVYPKRSCITAFQRRVAAMTELDSIMNYLAGHDDPVFQWKVLKSLITYIPAMQVGSDDPDSPLRRVRDRVGYFLRKLRPVST
jgi:hypothetical protein